MCVTMTSYAGSGLSGGSSSPKSSSTSSSYSSSKSAPSTPARVIIPQTTPQPSKSSGLSGGSGSRAPDTQVQQPAQKQVPAQGATSQMFAREAQKAAAVTTLNQMEQEKKAADTKAATVTAKTTEQKSQATSPGTYQSKNTSNNSQPQVVIVERNQQSNNNDFWNGMIMGQILNSRPSTVVVQSQPPVQPHVKADGDTASWSTAQSQPYAPTADTSTEGTSWAGIIAFFGLFVGLAVALYYVFTRRANAQANYHPNINLKGKP